MLPPGSEGFGRQVQDLDLDRWLRRWRSGHGVGVTADGAGIYVIYESTYYFIHTEQQKV